MLKKLNTILLLILAIALIVLMRVDGPSKFSLVNQASEHGIAPLDQDIPLNSEDQDASTTGDNEFEGDDLMVFERDAQQLPLLVQKQIVSRNVLNFVEHSMEITTPPPRA